MKIILQIVLVFISLSVSGQNLILNGGFENGLNQWQNLAGSGSTASFSIESQDVKTGGGALKSQVTKPGTNAWEVQSIHSGWQPATGVEHTLTFYAKALGNPSKIRLVQQNTTYASRDFDITTSWQKFTWTFTPTESSLQLKIHYFQAGTFIFDDFEILKPAGPEVLRTLTIDTASKHQVMTGFGGALTWHCDRITRSAKRTEIEDLLFNDLGADIIRLKNWYYPLNYPASKSPAVMEVDWFVPHYTATSQLASAAKKYNPEADILMSSWGPPSSLKNSGNLNGGTLKKNENGKFVYSEYAQYWDDVLANTTFKPDYISIQNEPGFENSGWTTTGFRPAETADYPAYSIALDSVYNKIKTRQYLPKLIGPETENIGSALWNSNENTFSSMAATVKDKSYLSAYAYHLYNFGSPGDINSSLLNMIRNEFSNKPNFMTEFSGANYDWLQTADMIQLNLTEANTSAYIYWEMMWDQNSTTAMISVDNSGNYTVSPYYFAIKHFSKFVNKGDRRINVTGNSSSLRTTGFLNKDGSTLTLIISNTGLAEEKVKLQSPSAQKTAQLYQSAEGNYFKNLGMVNIKDTVKIPARSLSTFMISLKDVVTAVNDNAESAVLVYPVPAENTIWLKGIENDQLWTVISPEGTTLTEGKGDSVNISELPAGLYFIKTAEGIYKFLKY